MLIMGYIAAAPNDYIPFCEYDPERVIEGASDAYGPFGVNTA